MKKPSNIPWLLTLNTAIFIIVAFICIIGSKTVNTITENVTFAHNKTVIIDAGHGGIDGGATSCTGVLESKLNLEIALRLEDLFHLLGIHTQMIRRTDCSVYTQGETIAAQKVSDLKNRVALINKTENAILVSIHQNYFSSGKYAGAQTFYGPAEGSEFLAKELQSVLVETINKGSRRKSKKASGIYLMQHIQHPGVLIECGFLSNPEEEYKLRTETYQKDLSCVISVVCANYLNHNTLS